jgi:uncharacterized repeat protein (TIGR01451 family)
MEIDRYEGGKLVFHINLDTLRDSVIGIDKGVQFYLGGGAGAGGDPQYATPIYLGPIVGRNSPLAVGGSETASGGGNTLTVERLADGPGKAGDVALRYEITVTTALEHWFVYWESHMAIGSSQWAGASLHAYTDEWGSKDVPIQVPEGPSGTDIAIVKTGPTDALVGEVITYSFTVTNNGPADALDVQATDDVLGTITLTGLTDEDGDGSADDLAVGATATGTAPYIVPLPGADPIVNTVTVTTTSTETDLTNNQDTWSVNVLRTGVEITKSADDTSAEVGQTVTYTIRVTNTGEVDLYITSLVDDVLGDLISHISDGVITVAEGYEEFTVDYVIPLPGDDPVDNRVDVSGENQYGEDSVSDFATESVNVLRTGVDITKSGPEYAEIGDTITYEITVTNTGEVYLYVTSLSDTLLGSLTPITDYIPGGVISAGGHVTFYVDYIVLASDVGSLLNTVTVEGENQFGADPVSDSDSWTVRVLPPSLVTSSGLCFDPSFDMNRDVAGRQFRLIFTPDSINTYTLRSSNPGQFYYNIFYMGDVGEAVTLTVTIPYPFVTQGAQPIHAYSDVMFSCGGCYIPTGAIPFTVTGTDTTTPSGALGISLGDHNGEYVTLTIEGTVPESGLFYVTIHLDYGLKGNSYTKSGDNAMDSPSIDQLTDYTFKASATGFYTSDTVQNDNVFKHDPGFAGLVQKDGEGVAGVAVDICDADGNLIATVYTDEDGWYSYYYRHRGKEATYIIKLPSYNLAESVQLKANKYKIVNFDVTGL